MSRRYRRSVINDEISQELDRAIALARESGLEGLAGQGEVGLVELSRALAARGYDGWVALETHYRPAPTAADLRSPRGESFSELGEQGTRECLVGWAEVLRRAGEGAPC